GAGGGTRPGHRAEGAVLEARRLALARREAAEAAEGPQGAESTGAAVLEEGALVQAPPEGRGRGGRADGGAARRRSAEGVVPEARPLALAAVALARPRQLRRPRREALRRAQDRLVAARSRARFEQRLRRASAGRTRAARTGHRGRGRAARARRARRRIEGVLRAAQAPAEERSSRHRVEPHR